VEEDRCRRPPHNLKRASSAAASHLHLRLGACVPLDRKSRKRFKKRKLFEEADALLEGGGGYASADPDYRSSGYGSAGGWQRLLPSLIVVLVILEGGGGGHCVGYTKSSNSAATATAVRVGPHPAGDQRRRRGELLAADCPWPGCRNHLSLPAQQAGSPAARLEPRCIV
jgi:hypothetical protein